jgi:hypothetical protein
VERIPEIIIISAFILSVLFCKNMYGVINFE